MTLKLLAGKTTRRVEHNISIVIFKRYMFRSKAIIIRRSPTKSLTIKIKCTCVNDDQTYPGGFDATDTDVRMCCSGHKTGCNEVHVTGIWWQCTFKIVGISGIEAAPDIVRSRMYHHHQQQQHRRISRSRRVPSVHGC